MTNLSLQKKSAARMAAAQSLYTAAITGEKHTPAQAVSALKKQLENNAQEQKLMVGQPIEPNYALAESLLAGVETFGDDIGAQIDGALSEGWKRERMSPLLLAILQCAVFELFFGKEIKPKIIVDEYTRLTRHFFSDAEVGFVHGLLSKLAEHHG